MTPEQRQERIADAALRTATGIVRTLAAIVIVAGLGALGFIGYLLYELVAWVTTK